MLIVIIRDGDRPSLKATRAGFVARLFGKRINVRYFYVCRNEKDKFRENWSSNTVDLATSPLGIFQYYTLMLLLKTPRELRDGIIRRIMTKHNFNTGDESFLTRISQALYQYFGRSARTARLMQFLRKNDSDKVFLIDGFFSINTVDLKKLKALGPIIYVSSDLAYDFYGDNIVASNLMFKFEQTVTAVSNLVIACSERDRLKYTRMGEKKALFYPNIFPIAEFEPDVKDQTPSIIIVLRGHWGSRADKSLKEVFKALSCIKRTINVTLIGTKPQKVPENVRLRHYEYIDGKLDFLMTLSRSWVGINLGIHAGGTNERKYDYAMAALVVLSDTCGVRGDILPHEYAYFDWYDLAAKLEQLLELGKESIDKMGLENRKQAISLAEKKLEELSKVLNNSKLCNY